MWLANKKKRYILLQLAALPVLIASLFSAGCTPGGHDPSPIQSPEQPKLKLPEPRYDSNVSLEQTLKTRRSIRTYTDEPLTVQEISQLLWAAQGITDPGGLRTAPSAGATYPLVTYLAVGNVNGINPGIYRYELTDHSLIKIREGDMRAEMAAAALGQSSVQDAAINIVFTAIYARTTARYGDRGIKYVHMEAGHAAQNIYLQATALKLGTVVVGAFHDDRMKDILNLSGDEQPLYIVPVGRPG